MILAHGIGRALRAGSALRWQRADASPRPAELARSALTGGQTFQRAASTEHALLIATTLRAAGASVRRRRRLGRRAAVAIFATLAGIAIRVGEASSGLVDALTQRAEFEMSDAVVVDVAVAGVALAQAARIAAYARA